MPTLPLTRLDDRQSSADLDTRAFTLTLARPIAINDLLLMLVRGTRLSIVPDPAISGSFIGELKNVTVRQALALILQPLGLDYSVAGGFIRVFRREPELRFFDIQYIATERTAAVTVDTPSRAGSVSHVSSTTGGDLYADLSKGTQALLSDRGTFNVDRKAGLLQVVDYPERLDRVAAYLEAVHDRVHRQVQIDTRIIEVELKDPSAGLDWNALSQAMRAGGAVSAAAPRTLTGLRATDVNRLLSVLAVQGRVSTVANPRILAMQNEPAIIRAVAREHGDLSMTVTAHIGTDRTVMLSLSPVLSRPAAAAAGEQDLVIQADTLIRVADGETLVLAGFPTTRSVTTPATGRNTRDTVTTRRIEILILLTPGILNSEVD